MASKNLLYVNREERKKEVLKALGKNEEEFEKDIDNLENWIKTQIHLPKMTTRQLLEWFYVGCKLSTEKCKQKLDTYYSIRSMMPEVFRDMNPNSEFMKNASDYVQYVTLPYLTKEHNKILLVNFINSDDERTITFCSHQAYNQAEIRMREELYVSNIIIMDLKQFSFRALTNLSPSFCRNSMTAFEKAFAGRIYNLHLLNCPSFIDKILSFLGMILPAKISKKIVTHTSVETLYEYVPKSHLPKEYGGSLPSIFELQDMWKEKIRSYEKLYNQLDDIKVDESLRPMPLNNDEILGYHGNFKKLSVD